MLYTNYHERLFKYFSDFSDKQQVEIRSDYDHLSEDEIVTGDWILYRSRVYHPSDFTSIHSPWSAGMPDFYRKWDGYLHDSAYSGIVMRYCKDDTDRYQIATFIGSDNEGNRS